MADATIRIDADTRDAERALGRIQGLLGKFATIAGLSAVAKQLGDIADSATNLQNKLQLVSSSQDYASYSFDKLTQIAINARAPLESVGNLYFSIARSAGILGVSNEQARQATELVSKGLTASGVSAKEAAGPLLQLSQAFQSGTFQGDELRSVLEGMPTVSQALAKSLGVPVTALKYLGSQGKITGQDLIKAILGARDSIEKDFAKTVPTIGQAFTVATTATTNFVSKLDQSTGATKTVAQAIISISNSLEQLAQDAESMKKLGDTIAFFVGWGLKIAAIISLFTAVGWVIRGVAAAGGILAAAWGGLVTVFNVVRNGIVGFSLILENLATPGISAWNVFRTLLLESATWLKPLLIPFTVFFTGIYELVTWVSSKWSGFVESMKNGANWLGGLVGVKPFDTGNGVSDSENQRELARLKAQQEARTKELRDLEDKKKKVAEISAKQFQYNDELRKTMEGQRISNEFDRLKGILLDEEVAYYRAIAEETKKAKDQGASLSPELARQVGELAKQKVLIEQIQAGYAKFAELVPTVGIAKQFNDDMRNLDAAYKAGRITNEEDYNKAVLELIYQREMAELDSMDRVANKELEMYAKRQQVKESELAQEIYRNGAKIQLGGMEFNAYKGNADMAKQVAKDRVDFEKKSEMEKASFAIDQAAMMFNALGQHNRQAFQAAKAFNIAQAIMNAYLGATKALATYPPPFGALAAVATVAMGMAQVAQIQSQQYSGRAIGGPVNANQPYMVGENGPELFVPQGAGRIAPNNEVANQPMVINLNIQAVDARGVDQLLMERKGMIVGMIRSAINDRGVKAPM